MQGSRRRIKSLNCGIEAPTNAGCNKNFKHMASGVAREVQTGGLSLYSRLPALRPQEADEAPALTTNSRKSTA